MREAKLQPGDTNAAAKSGRVKSSSAKTKYRRVAKLALAAVGVFSGSAWAAHQPHAVSSRTGTFDTAQSATPGARAPSRLTLRVYNYAGVNRLGLARARIVVSTAFHGSDVEIVWIDCPVDSKTYPQAYAACQTHVGSNDLIVRILSHRIAMRARASDEPLGSAQICPENEPACGVNVFYNQLDQLAAEGYRSELLLGYVIAHEAGHILIGPKHSDEGIMRGEWNRQDLRRMSWGMQIAFTNEQSEQLRAAVFRRASPLRQNSEPVTSAGH